MAFLRESNKKWRSRAVRTHRRLERSTLRWGCTSKRRLRTMAIISRNRLRLSALSEIKDLSNRLEKERFVAFPWTKNDQLLSRKALKSPVLTQSVMTFQQSMPLLRGLHDDCLSSTMNRSFQWYVYQSNSASTC